MNRISLVERICASPGSQVCVLASELGAWSRADVAQAWRLPALRELVGKGSVALMLSDPVKMALALIALDGQVDRLLLLSSTTSAEVQLDLLGHFQPSVTLTDQPAGAQSPSGAVAFWTDATSRPARPYGAVVSRRLKDTTWTLATTGTTGHPKLVEHSFASLTRTTRSLTDFESALVWGQLFEMCRFAGVQVFLQGVLGGGGLIVPCPAWTLADQFRMLAAHGCSAISATPTLWRKALMLAESRALHLKQVTLGGEIADDALLRALSSGFPLARIVHVYASTEAGVGFSVKDGRAGFPSDYLKKSSQGIRLRVSDGRLFVQNCEVRSAYVGLEQAFADDEGYVDTGDLVELRGERYYFRGRSNGAINVGGNKLYPEEVERILLDHDEVRLARVFAKASPITGQLVMAEVVATCAPHGRAALVSELMMICRDRLKRWQTPVTIRVVEDIDSNAGGKVKRGLL